MALPVYNTKDGPVVATELTNSDLKSFNYSETTLSPEDHFLKENDIRPNTIEAGTVFTKEAHFIKDVNDPVYKNGPTSYVDLNENTPTVTPIFAGSATDVNPLNDPEMQKIIDTGLENYESDGGLTTPVISPFQPFTRSNPRIARKANLFTYNRTKLPIADIEYRKGFRHLFITRPECYIVCNDGGIRLCEQALYDEEFSSIYTRMPYALEVLSPFYITGSWSEDSLLTNWNFLLSNRVQGFSPGGMSIGVNDGVSKSVSGYSITPGSIIDSDVGGTFELLFKETKYLECYETLRAWMMYISKRHKGYFSPSFNGYKYKNNFYTNTGQIFDQGLILHPYDRAIDYASTIFDIVTDETGRKIIYWCKYYGVYPVSAALSLSNENNQPMTEMSCSATFRYMYKLENTNKSLIEFNYNAGIVSKTGRLTALAEESLPYLIREDNDNQLGYLGAAGMFTGSPYIVMGIDPMPNNRTLENTVSPYLKFANISFNSPNSEINTVMNQMLVNSDTEDNSYPISI